MKVLSIIALLISSVMCSLEPAGYRSSSTYLPPNFGRRTSSLSSTYLPPSRTSNTYSSSQSSYNQQSRGQGHYHRRQDAYQLSSYQPSQVYNSVSSSTYLPPAAAPAALSNHQSSSIPSNTYIPSTIKDSYSLPEVNDVRSSSLLSSTYGLPGYASAQFRGHHRHNHEDDYNSEPVKYNFGYQVNDNYGNDYSHHESRIGAKTRGSYSVLLPDGRKQIVEYEADEAGYRPKISYENVQTDRAAYPGGGPY